MAIEEKTCCFTGHRNIPQEEKEAMTSRLEEIIARLFQAGITRFVAGGAMGFDTLAAQAVLRLRQKYPEIQLLLALPCRSQTRGWSAEHIAQYEAIKAQANDVVYTAQDYSRGCMQKRNRYMVDNSSVCVCYCTRGKGGTAYTVRYAEKKGLPVINIGRQTD